MACPPSLANLLFAVKKGEAATAPNDSGTNPGHVVAVVADIQPANPAQRYGWHEEAGR